MPGHRQEAIAVLVVEDEAVLRFLGVEMFSTAGFHVVEAENAQVALDLLRALAAVHLIFTDVAMPGPIDGLALAHHVSERWPHIGIIIVSGHGFPRFGPSPRSTVSRQTVRPGTGASPRS